MQARVDFYIVADLALPYRFICQLTGKIRSEGYEIYIHAASRDEAEKIDDLLWTFQDISFLPHSLIDSAADGGYPIIIGWEGRERLQRPVLINLSGALPEPMDGYQRIIEVVTSDPEYRAQARQRYKDYRDRGLELHSHDTGAPHA